MKRALPRKSGIYRGPRSLTAAWERIDDGESPDEVVKMMRDAGYKGAAAKLRSELAKASDDKPTDRRIRGPV